MVQGNTADSYNRMTDSFLEEVAAIELLTQEHSLPQTTKYSLLRMAREEFSLDPEGVPQELWEAALETTGLTGYEAPLKKTVERAG